MCLPSASLSTRFRRASSFLPSGVFVVQAGKVALTVGSLQCVSFDPPWISVALSKDTQRSAAILAENRFVAKQLREDDKRAAHDPECFASEALLEMECQIAAVHDVGDHHLVLAKVLDVRTALGRPLIHWRRALLRLDVRYPFLNSAQSLHTFVGHWEAGTLPKDQFTHAAHVAVSACYAVRFGEGALSKMRAGILAYNQSTRTPNTDSSGYHETLTCFWAAMIADTVRGMTDPWMAARKAVDEFGEDRDLHRLFYSFDVVASVAARRTAVPPDLAR